jgi:hypothetical protein
MVPIGTSSGSGDHHVRIIMSLSMYQAFVPPVVHQFSALSKILAKGEAFAGEKGIDPATLTEARLAEDMFPLARQVQVASDIIKGGVARLAGIDIPSFPDTETTFAELQERIARTIAFVESVSADRIDGSEQKTVTLKAGEQEFPFIGQDYLLQFVLPNFYFHITTAYALLRQAGVPIGKRDFLGM